MSHSFFARIHPFARLLIAVLFVLLTSADWLVAQEKRQADQIENVAIWPDLAPGETSRHTGDTLPMRAQDKPPITRVKNVRLPTIDVFPAADPNGVGVVILPGGGFGRIVPDLEGSEPAEILNKHGISAFVLNYRTKLDKKDPGWTRPLQDSQRAMAWLRKNADRYKLDQEKIGLLGFSAGGQVVARHLTDKQVLAYPKIDEVDDTSHRADFSILIYPWNMYDAKKDSLIAALEVQNDAPPTFIVHTSDDRSSSLGAVLFYAGLKKAGVESELHVYANGGHGYGVRAKPNSNIGTWSARMEDWLKTRGLSNQK